MDKVEAVDLKMSDLVGALADPERAEALMREQDLTRDDLVRYADRVAKDLSSKISAVNIV